MKKTKDEDIRQGKRAKKEREEKEKLKKRQDLQAQHPIEDEKFSQIEKQTLKMQVTILNMDSNYISPLMLDCDGKEERE